MNSYLTVKRTIEYLEGHESEKLDLETVAKKMNYSKFHFHRLFLSEMGVSLTDFIRRRRLIQSVFDLEMTTETITLIALDRGFGNPDTFIRAFKDYYGLTPGQYRKLTREANRRYKKGNQKEMKIEYSLYTGCSQKDKEDCLSIISKMVSLSITAHQSGLLSLEAAMEDESSIFLQKGIELLLQGTKPSRLRSMMSNYIQASALGAGEILKRVVMLEGVLLIQEGAYPWDIRNELFSYLGEGMMENLDRQWNTSDCLPDFIKQETIACDNSKLLKTLKQMNKRGLQRLLRECDPLIIASALKGMPSELKMTILEALPLGRKKILCEATMYFDDLLIHSINDASNEMLKTINQLRLSKDL